MLWVSSGFQTLENNKTAFSVLYSDKTWVFDQRERAQGPIYISFFHMQVLHLGQFLQVFSFSIDHFTVVCSATWPVDGSEARVDLVLIQTSLLLSCKCTLLKSEQLVLHNKRSEVCIKTRSTLASLPSKGQVTKQTTVKWSIV